MDWGFLSMSISRRTSLGEYIVALIETLGAADPAAVPRMRQIVGERRARIVLDNEAVDVWFSPDGLRVAPAERGSQVDGSGMTDTATVLALLDGTVEVTDAILDGQLLVTGSAQEIARMFTAIEILLDATPRVPELRALAHQFRVERSDIYRHSAPGTGTAPWYPFRSGRREMDLLSRLGLV
jgi:hypothetical protein